MIYLQTVKGGYIMPKNTAAKMRANKKYSEKAYDRISLILPKGQKRQIKALADNMGLSVNGYISKAIQRQIAVDKRGN